MATLVQPDLLALLFHLVGTLVFAGVFLFLYRDSKILYFGYWSLAWVLVACAQSFHLLSRLTGRTQWLFPYALLELAFTLSIMFAAASALGKFNIRVSWPAAFVPILLLLGYLLGLFSDFEGFYALNSLLLTAAYGWNFLAFRKEWGKGRGAGQKLFSVSLLVSSLLYSHYALVYASLHFAGTGSLPAHLRFHDFYDLTLEMLLAFSGMMLWMESRNDQLERLNADLAESRSELARSARLDPLTGLMNRAALDQVCADRELVVGVVAVIDLDNFKDVNDVLGHLIGDEVLAAVGNLIKTSIRKEDEAWRWGGDEFVVLFRDQSRGFAEDRMQALEQRLLRFRIRGRGVLPIHISWGTADVVDRSLRETLAEADQRMYLQKRDKTSPSKFFGTA